MLGIYECVTEDREVLTMGGLSLCRVAVEPMEFEGSKN